MRHNMMENLYTVIDNNGDVLNAGLTLEEAAHEILIDDGRSYEIKKDANNDNWVLFTKRLNDRTSQETCIFSIEKDKKLARMDVFKRVVMEAEAVWWGAQAIRDEWYKEELQGLIADSAEMGDEQGKEQLEDQLSEWEYMRAAA